MTIEDCYNEFNGDYKDVFNRLLTEARVEKFALRFLDTSDLIKLNEAISKKDWNEAFIIAHTAKGMSLNLGFSNYAKYVSEITEILRPRAVADSDIPKINELLQQANVESDKIKTTLTKYMAQKNI